LLSIRAVFPRKGGRVWYEDQRRLHQQIFAGDEELVRSAQVVLEPSPAAIATTSSPPAVEEASSERTAVVTILFPAHLFPYAVKM
jgi:hypothetical protein